MAKKKFKVVVSQAKQTLYTGLFDLCFCFCKFLLMFFLNLDQLQFYPEQCYYSSSNVIIPVNKSLLTFYKLHDFWNYFYFVIYIEVYIC